VSIRFFQPWPALRDVISRLYAHDSPASEVAEPRWLIVPDGEIKLIFPFEGDITCTIGSAARRHRAARVIVSGMRTIPGRLEFPEGVAAIGVIIRPEAVYRLIDIPHHELANRTLDGEEVLGPALARGWADEWLHADGLEARVERIQAAIRARVIAVAPRVRRAPAFEHAVRRMRQSSGRVRIDALAHEIGWSRRHLARVFQEHGGVSPSELAGVLRFHAVYRQLRAVPAASASGLIYDYYYDHSHFLKDFKRYTGGTLRAYLLASGHDYGRLYIPGDSSGAAVRARLAAMKARATESV
jgi:methylphosphotriester-DNA--protein-cysteine methyltransferase